ncbi:2-oxoacid:acceptor oxidoreductase family protein [bacterium]|nr:2-oxoacid:acceptor oxidoreductase family protein [bacterium]
MLVEMIFAGFGGQGIMTLGMTLAYAGMIEDKNVAWIPSYGPEMRGGTANCNVIISDDVIGSPTTDTPGAVMVMNLPSFHKFEPKIKPGGTLIVNSSLISDVSKRDDIKSFYLDTAGVAKELGNLVFAGMVALGGLNEAMNLVKTESLEMALKKLLPEHRHKLIPLNVEALGRGAALVKNGS